MGGSEVGLAKRGDVAGELGRVGGGCRHVFDQGMNKSMQGFVLVFIVYLNNSYQTKLI